MSEAVGPRNVSFAFANEIDPNAGTILRKKVDDEVDRILLEQYERGMAILEENREVLDAIAKLLIEKEKVSGIELLRRIEATKPGLISKEKLATAEEYGQLVSSSDNKN